MDGMTRQQTKIQMTLGKCKLIKDYLLSLNDSEETNMFLLTFIQKDATLCKSILMRIYVVSEDTIEVNM